MFKFHFSFIFLAFLILLLYGAFIAGHSSYPLLDIKKASIVVEKMSENEYMNFTPEMQEPQGPALIDTHALGHSQTGEATEGEGGLFVASTQGTKYHLSWCASAKSISDANKIFFSSRSEAEEAGYEPASNCKEIELFDPE